MELKKVRCPYCGAANAIGSNICGTCFRDIREFANPARRDLEPTVKTEPPRLNLWKRILKKLGRRRAGKR